MIYISYPIRSTLLSPNHHRITVSQTFTSPSSVSGTTPLHCTQIRLLLNSHCIPDKRTLLLSGTNPPLIIPNSSIPIIHSHILLTPNGSHNPSWTGHIFRSSIACLLSAGSRHFEPTTYKGGRMPTSKLKRGRGGPRRNLLSLGAVNALRTERHEETMYEKSLR